MITALSTSAATTYSTPSTASTATASISTFNSCQCSKDLVELERQKVSLLKDVCGLLREAAKRDSKFLEDDINWKFNNIKCLEHSNKIHWLLNPAQQ
jgi:hypothetical protein